MKERWVQWDTGARGDVLGTVEGRLRGDVRPDREFFSSKDGHPG